MTTSDPRPVDNTGPVDNSWHVSDEELRRYGDTTLASPWLWSLEAHLAACADCRRRLAAAADQDRVAAGWSRLDAALDRPHRGPVERMMVRVRVPETTARLIAVTPGLRAPWLLAVTLTLTLTTLASHLAQAAAAPLVFLGVAPALPMVGVALSFGPRLDPSYELVAVTPLHTFRLLLLRTLAVLATTSVLSGCASLALPGFGLVVLGWLLPGVALTLLTLALIPRLGPLLAPTLTGTGWVAALLATVHPNTGSSVIFSPIGQLWATVAVLFAALVLTASRSAFATSRRLNLARPAGPWRNP
ncbi:zf-HC2 domain-containing protein [Frankia sp. Ag45/Mut15]|uniref:Zf-HC2 domain-containing protein n=1 Tax=Frankia umida TaxID=573489 RepID=A0ABT0JVU1_9ACTN|nr:zf-HC2 domain-containing protein [Frankia umida]MCK9875469.1 zf-HC2 domain-containing protein [Frankia umida]